VSQIESDVVEISKDQFEEAKKLKGVSKKIKWARILSPLLEGKAEALKIKVDKKSSSGLATYIKMRYGFDAFRLREGDSYYLYVSKKGDVNDKTKSDATL